MELWKKIPGYQDKYALSNDMRVKSNARKVVLKRGGIRNVEESIKKIRTNAKGVNMVNLFDGKTRVTRSVDVLMRDIWGGN